MPEPRFAFVVLQQTAENEWRSLGEFPRRPGLSARAARRRAIEEAIGRPANDGEVYAAVLRSEWRVALDN